MVTRDGGKGSGRWANWVKGSGTYRLPVYGVSHGNERCSIENKVSGIVIVMYGR